MKFFYRLLSIAALTVLVLAGCSKQGPIDSNQNGSSTDHYIVILKMNTGGIQSSAPAHEKIVSYIKTHGIALEKITYVYDNVLNGFAATLTRDQANALSQDNNVKLVEKDQLVTLSDQVEAITDYKAGKAILSQSNPWGVTYVGGSINCSSSTFTKKAWIVDTGIDLDHPDLNVYTPQCTTFVRTGQDARNADDNNGHGSHVAGIIAARDNSVGVVGIAAGARVVAVKVLNRQGSGYTSDIVAGLNYVFANKSAGDVVNLSLGGSISQALDDAVAQFGAYNDANPNAKVFVTVAAGNSSDYAGNYSPARTNGTGIYTISAFDNTGSWASFSNYGYSNPVDYSAPGVSITSCYKNGGYATMSGTSMAAPHAAGILLATGGITASGTVTDSQGTAEPKAHE